MFRLARIALVVSLAALVAPTVAGASLRMPIGFQDDPTFRWNGNVEQELDLVQQANASIIRATADWRAIAPTRPRSATNSFDPAYKLDDLDNLVRQAQQRGLQVMITIWGTPKWANGGKGPNTMPKRLADLTQFARALADRYSGRHAGFPYVGHYSVWNEPNLGIFLTPQFDSKGRIVSPRLYGALYKAAYTGIKTGNRTALVAIGETSNQGRDHPLKGVNDSVAPGTFARLLAQQKGLRFDAYAEHPYATVPSASPAQKVRFPNVTMTQLPHFEKMLDLWFHRKVPVWVTEYGYQTRPPQSYGVSYAKQAAYMQTVIRQLRADPNVHMFIWFIFHDNKQSLWKSGVFDYSGGQKPAYRTFSGLAAMTAGDTQVVKAGRAPSVTLSVPRLAYQSAVGETIGITYFVYSGTKVIASGQPTAPMRIDGTVRFTALFTPVAGKTYQIQMDAQDIHGNHAVWTYALEATKTGR